MKKNLKQIIFLGGGHTNTLALRELAMRGFMNKNSEKLRVKLISDYPKSAYSGTIPGTVCGYYNSEKSFIYLDKFSKFANIDFKLGKAVKLEPDTNRLILESGEEITYDLLSINVGSRTLGSFSVPGVFENALTTRPISAFLGKIEKKEKQLDLKNSHSNEPIRIGIVGGGVSGLELGFSFNYRVKKLFGRNTDITIFDNQKTLLPSYHPSVVKQLTDYAAIRNIKFENSAIVTGVVGNTVQFNNKNNTFDIIVWATGPEPHDFNYKSNLDLKKGWISVKDTLQTLKYKNIFGCGDCINIDNYDNFPPKSGVYAVREASILSQNIEKCSNGENNLSQYIPQKDFLALITLGEDISFGTKFGISFKGKWVWNLKKYIDVSFMNLFHEEINPANNKNIFANNTDTFNFSPKECIKYLIESENEETFDKQLKIIDQLAKDENLLKEIKSLLNLI